MSSSCSDPRNFSETSKKKRLILFPVSVLIGLCFTSVPKFTYAVFQKPFVSFYQQYMTVTGAAVVLFLLLFIAYLRLVYSYWAKLNVPGPKPSPVVGHTLQRLGITKHILKFYEDIYYKHNGKDFCGYYDFLRPGLVVGNPQLIRNITVKDFDHFANRRVLALAKVNPIANDMLSNATGENWQRIRTAVSPVFTNHKLKQMYDLICTQTDQFVTLLGDKGKNCQELEMSQVCGHFTMDIITSCAFGIDCDAMNSDKAMFAQMASKIFVLSPARAVKMIILIVLPFLARLIQMLGIDFTSEEFHFLHQVVTKTLRMREREGIRRGDFLDLMKDTNKLSETTMTAQAVLFLIAGHSNTAGTLSFALHLLAVNQEVQHELRTELLNANRKENGNLEFDELQKLPLLDAVVKETLRLYPADPTMERICTKDYEIPGTKLVIRKGQSVIIPIWCLHHDPAYWQDPDSFQPARFLGTAGKDLPHYIPFGRGPRQCIGMKFVHLVVKVAIQKIISTHRVTPAPKTLHPPPINPRGFLSIMPAHGLPLRISPLGET